MKMFNFTRNISDDADHVTNAAGATIVSPLLMSLTGVIGNILALISLYKTRTDVRTTKFYSLIKGLVWADLLGILITSPSVIIAYAHQREWLGGSTHCLFHGFTMATFGLATPLIICAMAVERFLALKCVFFYSSRCRTGTARGCLLLLWLGTILFGLLPLFGFGRYEKQYPGTWCYLDFHSDDMVSKVYNYIYACTTLTLIFLIIICNTYAVVRILKTKVRRSSECVYTIGHNRPEQASLVTIRNQQVKSNDTESSMIVLLLALTLVFTTCWAPLMIRIIDTQVSGEDNVLFDLAAVRLASLNQTLDPWLYILFRRSTCRHIAKSAKKIKAKFLNTIRKKSPRENNQESLNKDNVDSDKKGIVENKYRCKMEENLPDLMQTFGERSDLPLPDVTMSSESKNSENSMYVCHFQIGNSVAEDINNGMYVKILYLKNNSDSKESSS